MATAQPEIRLRSRLTRRLNVERTEVTLGAFSVLMLVLIGGMMAYVFVKAWPSFSHNGLAWFGSGGDANQQLNAIYHGGSVHPTYHLRAFPFLYGTVLCTGLAVVIGLVFALLSAIFIVEFAPPGIARIMTPIVRLLAGVPSVVFGLVGILVVVPWINDHLVSARFKLDVKPVVPVTGFGLLAAVLILALMVTPIMIAIIVDALRAVPTPWIEGSAALGVNRWRTMWRVSVRTARPAIAAAVVLATARALGEAIMLVMVSGAFAFSPNPLDGGNMFLEPISPLAATIVQNAEGLANPPFAHTIYAFAAVLLVSSAFLSLAGWAARQPLRKYGLR